jgi:hypothetical protein
MDETTTNSITLSYQDLKLTGEGDLAVIGVLVLLGVVALSSIFVFGKKILKLTSQARPPTLPPPRE